MRKLFLAICTVAMATFMASCGGNSASTTPNADSTAKDSVKAEAPAAQADTTQAVDLNKKYVCPARDYASDEPGTCPNCGMDLESSENF